MRSLMNTKAFANLKGSGGNIWEVFEVLDDARRAIFRDTVFGYFIDVPRLQGDALLFHKMFLHQIRPDPVLSPDGIKRLYFRVGNTKMVYGPEEFCLITGFNFGEYPKNIGRKGSEKLISSKKRCLLRERLFPDHTNSSVKIGDLKSLIVNQTFLALDDFDAVRVCLIYTLCEGFLGKEVNDRVPQDWFYLAENLDLWNIFAWGSYLWDFTYVDLEDTWNKIHNYLSLPERGQTLKYSVSGFTAPIRIWIYEMIPPVRACGFASRKNKELPRIIVKLKRYYCLLNYEWEERNDNAGNKFDDDVPDEDELIITENVDFFHDDDDDKEVTPDKPRSRKPSQHLCPPYTELHTTPKQKRRTKNKVDMKSTSPVPPPVFGVAHDFSMLRLQPYVAGSEDVIQNYVLHSYDVQHRLFNFVLDRDFWSSLFGHTHDGWLESASITKVSCVQHITIWYRLLMERRFESDRHTIMPPNFFVSHALEEGQDWQAFMAGIATYPNFMVAWWDVDTVLLPIHSSPNHWLFGELRLASMEVHIYDSLGRGAYEKFQSEGIFSKFERRVANYLDKIKYWARRNIPRIPLNMQFIYEENVPQQSSHLGDCGVFLCMFMEQLVSGQPIRVLIHLHFHIQKLRFDISSSSILSAVH
uniref:Ubiquitin-like protease family profile domain-containing protein n=2 Tax=Lactuca sativa TaxID=4236 RepID=A0A9R1W300_LACSA|nr:hypothetical protein LSAT_V11C300126060 [Lactuca sativa]